MHANICALQHFLILNNVKYSCNANSKFQQHRLYIILKYLTILIYNTGGNTLSRILHENENY